MILDLLIIGAGGFLGAVVRYLGYVAVRSSVQTPLPLATFLINVSGCLAIGALMVFVERAGPFHRHLLLAGGVGFLGSYTTFSAFGFETLELLRAGQPGLAAANAAANVVLGLAAVWAGRAAVS
jgi:CrcB protein